MARPKRNTPAGRAAIAKYKMSMVKKYGSYDAYREAMKANAKKGGSVSHPETRTFVIRGREWASECGRKGGTISSRAQDKSSLVERREKYQLKERRKNNGTGSN